jgi:hypothetical protein
MAVTKDALKLLPRAMGRFIYQNRLDYARGMTVVQRQIMINPLKNRDVEEIRKIAYERLMRDIPYCVEAFKGGEIKLDTDPGNLAARLGMITYFIALQSFPAFPDLEYFEKFQRAFDQAVAEYQIDVWVYYDGYGDFHSLGELMERFQPTGMPRMVHRKSDEDVIRMGQSEPYSLRMGLDPFAMFRAPAKWNISMVYSDTDLNDVYNRIVNNILDAYVYIWKCSGMDLAHASYAAPPGTIVARPSRRRSISGGVLTRIMRKPPKEPAPSEAKPDEGPPTGFEEQPQLEEEAPAPPTPSEGRRPPTEPQAAPPRPVEQPSPPQLPPEETSSGPSAQ